MTPYLDELTTTYPLRMFCFPHAGGGAAVFRAWQLALSPLATVCPIHLPGRESRSGEARFVDLDALVEDLDRQLEVYLEEPHVFFGHSMGALVAYRLACRRRDRGLSLPRALLLSGYAAPHLPSALPASLGLDDAALAHLLTELGGLPAEILAWPQWLHQLLPVLRDDLAVCESYRDRGDPPLPCPIHVFGGDADPIVDELDLAEWNRYSTDIGGVRILSGDHFYLESSPAALFGELRELLRTYAQVV